MRWCLATISWMLATAACGSEPPADEPPPGGCEGGQLSLVEEECVPVGAAPASCAAGFVFDAGGCEPVLPPASCPPGQLAVPGETECRLVAPCGEGTWGDIPVDETTHFVDRSYTGGASNGTAEQPWTGINDAVEAAPPGALVAIAAGRYQEDLYVLKSLRFWGRCPELVEIAGAGVEVGALDIRGPDSEVHTLAITGPGVGYVQTTATGVLVDRVWIHDTGSRGVTLQDDFGAPTTEFRGSLIEGSGRGAAF
ncbi:MAG: hypothetical protein JRI23_11380, partial [Deltaproteobacteria bacterium]|nr:hypothetical protein [Deltaproteobacteria bacterium]MBW2532299.1 hypothetical protein [Deltaproteobacteria bacterium]